MNAPLKRLRVLASILKRTHAGSILGGFVVFFFACALVIMLFEPSITSYGDALWYCYAVIMTTGFGDVTVASFGARVTSVFLSLYALLVVAIVTGVVVNYYTESISSQAHESISLYMDKLERLPELSHDELEEMAQNVRNLR